MSRHLPLQIRKDVRDGFEKEDCPTQKALGKVAEMIGYPVSCDPEWYMLWTELEPAYPDKAIFVPSIAKIVEAWCDSLARRLEDDKFEGWTELLLDKLKVVNRVQLSVQVGDESRLATMWSEAKSTFSVLLPKKTAPPISQAASAFAQDLDSLFEPKKAANPPQQPHTQEDDDWADLTSNADTRSLSFRSRPNDSAANVAEALPALQTLPRPEILFQQTAPYLMHVICSGTSKVTVNGTHEPSLRLLAEYLQRWIKTDPQDIRKIPDLRVKLQESKFGLGLFHDSLTIEPFDHHQRNIVINVSLILAFIQGILGYQPLPGSTNGSYWEFHRNTAFV